MSGFRIETKGVDWIWGIAIVGGMITNNNPLAVRSTRLQLRSTPNPGGSFCPKLPLDKVTQ
jgi:hypothetical protein